LLTIEDYKRAKTIGPTVRLADHDEFAWRPTTRGLSMVRTGKEAEYQFLPIECPKCGLQGKIKISRLDQSFTCKKCNKVFHVTLDGVVAGERPPADPLSRLDQPMVDKSPWLVRKIEGLPRVGKWLLLGAMIAAGLYYLSGLLTPDDPLPDGLEERVELAVKSYAFGDWKTLKRMAAPGTARELGKWYDLARPAEWSDVGPDSAVDFEVGGIKRDIRPSKGGNKPIVAHKVEGVIRPTGKKESKFVLLWIEGKRRTWWLDGEEMAKGMRAPAKPQAKGEKPAAKPSEAPDG
jgi:hypothetical protein